MEHCQMTQDGGSIKILIAWKIQRYSSVGRLPYAQDVGNIKILIECSERERRESLAAGDHPENWRAAFTRWRAAV